MESIFDRFAKRAGANPILNGTLPLTSTTLAALLTGKPTGSGIAVSRENTVGLSAVYRAWSVLSSSIAGSALEVTTRADAKPVVAPLLDMPHDMFTAYEFWELVVVHLMSDGNHYSLKNGGKGAGPGRPITSLFPLDPNKLQPVWVFANDDPRGTGVPLERGYKTSTRDGTEVLLTDNEVWHVPGMGFDGLKGLSPIRVAQEMLGTNMAAEQFAGRLFGSGSLMSGILTTDSRLSDDQAKSLKQRWQSKIAGLDHAHEITILDSGAKFESLSIKPEEAQFIQARNFGVNEVARLFGVSPNLLMADQSLSTNSTGIEQENIAFSLFSLRGLASRIQGRIDRDLINPTEQSKFSLKDFERGDTKTRSAAWLLARKASVMTINELRKDEGLQPIAVPEADDLFAPLAGGGEEAGGADEGADTTDQGGGGGTGDGAGAV